MQTTAELPARTQTDSIEERRISTSSDLLRAGAEIRSGVLVVPGNVQNRIRRIGDLVHAKLEGESVSTLSKAFKDWTETRFAGREAKSLAKAECLELLEKLRSLGGGDLRRFERRISQLFDRKAGLLDYANWREIHSAAETAIKSWLEYRKGDAEGRFEKGDFVFDKTLD